MQHSYKSSFAVFKIIKGVVKCADHLTRWVLHMFYMALPNPERGW